jgi:hypothetical protein
MKIRTAVCAVLVLVAGTASPSFGAELKIFGSRVTKMMVGDIGP